MRKLSPVCLCLCRPAFTSATLNLPKTALKMSLRSKVIAMYRLAVDTGTFNRVLHMVEIGDVFKGKLLADIKVTSAECNIVGTLHGGFMATLFDHLSTLALNSHFLADGKEVPTSVSIDLSMTYISGVKDGQRIRMETETLRVGRKMAFLTANIYNQDKNNELVATGKHTKYIL